MIPNMRLFVRHNVIEQHRKSGVVIPNMRVFDRHNVIEQHRKSDVCKVTENAVSEIKQNVSTFKLENCVSNCKMHFYLFVYSVELFYVHKLEICVSIVTLMTVK